MRETIKKVTRKVEDEERTFQIRKMNALQGSCLLKFVTEKLLPLLDGAQKIFVSPQEGETEEEVTKKRTEAVMEIIPKALSSISDQELIDFEKRCLRTVDILMPAGWQPVMDGDEFGVEELEYDPMIALLLCYDVVEFNFSGFFGGKGLSSALLPQNISQ